MLSLGDDKYYCTSLPQFFRVLIPHPLQIISAVDLAAWVRFYRFPFVLIFFFIFAFETLKKSILCQGKVSAVGTGDFCQPTAQVHSGCASRIALFRTSYLELVETSRTGLASRSTSTCWAWQLR